MIAETQRKVSARSGVQHYLYQNQIKKLPHMLLFWLTNHKYLASLEEFFNTTVALAKNKRKRSSESTFKLTLDSLI